MVPAAMRVVPRPGGSSNNNENGEDITVIMRIIIINLINGNYGHLIIVCRR